MDGQARRSNLEVLGRRFNSSMYFSTLREDGDQQLCYSHGNQRLSESACGSPWQQGNGAELSVQLPGEKCSSKNTGSRLDILVPCRHLVSGGC
ncbi:hypothetical protein DPEC_G00200390 [Dallia pectoralis]|uniref:Uncharacterized protein n=1 Tax=Dallia pectoralis TaxID=75939 RepID=A0ACC2G8U5_DALPE|nr:hypothetical protein DPEC_G00200390 [Dallia pectoralis]